MEKLHIRETDRLSLGNMFSLINRWQYWSPWIGGGCCNAICCCYGKWFTVPPSHRELRMGRTASVSLEFRDGLGAPIRLWSPNRWCNGDDSQVQQLWHYEFIWRRNIFLENVLQKRVSRAVDCNNYDNNSPGPTQRHNKRPIILVGIKRLAYHWQSIQLISETDIYRQIKSVSHAILAELWRWENGRRVNSAHILAKWWGTGLINNN